MQILIILCIWLLIAILIAPIVGKILKRLDEK